MTDDFRHRTRVEVRFRDIDAFGHVNNAVVSSYVELARIRYLVDVLQVEPIGVMPLILAHISIDYRSPILFNDTVEVGSRVDWLGTSSIGMSHELSAAADGRELAESSSVLVTFDYEQGRPMPVPDEWRQALATYEGRTLERSVATA
ncbi:MAG TPA: thioesterase family protein [Candidatus Limnocylindria bacterium]